MRSKRLLGLLFAIAVVAWMTAGSALRALPPASASPEAAEVPYGPWVDEVVFFSEKDLAKAVDMMEKGDMHLYFIDISDPDLFARVKASPNLKYKFAYGLYNELTFNPVGPEFKNGEFNPFCNPRIREAMNYIIDRNYIVNEIYKGLAKPKWVPLISAFPEYGRLADVIKLLEARYKYDFEKGKNIIFEELTKMGCEYREGKWYYKGKPIVIKFLIRIEDQRKQIGDYVADQLEKLGFTVERLYKSSREASPIWLFSDPAEGKWHIYTGGWITTVVSRDDSDVFGFFYTPLGLPVPLWQAYKPDPTFYEVARKLWNREFRTEEERLQLMAKALELALKDSVRIWLIDQVSPFVMRKEVDVACDLSGGFATAMWARTIRFTDKVGGMVKAGNREVLVDPWNPVAPTDWVYDTVVIYATRDYATLINPYTGLPMANRFINATVYVEKGLRVKSSSDWLKVVQVDKIEVPSDAWFAWDVKEKKVVGPPPGTYAKAKIVVNYGHVIGKVKYHDGSVMTKADWVGLWPFGWERAENPDSPLYDEAAVPAHEEWRKNWRGMRIISWDPLVIEYYINYTHSEAEFMVDWAADWPAYPWHMRAIGIMAEEKGLLAFSSAKADKLKVEWMNYIGGPSIEVLKKMLDEAMETGYVPFYDEWAKNYITPEEAKARYENLKKWFEAHGHFWVADGPFYLDRADFTAHQAVLKAFREYTFKADRWAWLATPPIPEATVSVPENVVPGLPAEFKISLSFAGKPYPNNRMEFVKYVLLDSEGNVVGKGMANATAEGEWTITLPDTLTAKLTPGTYRIMAIALSKDVATPAIVETPFTVIPLTSYLRSEIAALKSTVEARVSGIETSIEEVSTRIQALEGAVSSLQTIAAGSLAVAVIALIAAIYAIVSARRAGRGG